MNQEPKLLVWNFTMDEKEKLDTLLREIGAPSAVTIKSTQGHLTMREIIHADTHCEKELASCEKVVFFYNIPQKGVFFLINTLKQTDLPHPIYAIVTEHSIELPFNELLEHLASERDRMERASKAGSERQDRDSESH
jgi:hypothetical protein